MIVYYVLKNILINIISNFWRFEALFAKLESSKELLGIESYGVTVTTLEDVFLKLV